MEYVSYNRYLSAMRDYLEKKVKYLYVSEGFGLMQTTENFNFSTDTECLRFSLGSYLIFQNWKWEIRSSLALNCRHYDILEHRVPSGLVADYHNYLSQCEELYRKFLNVRNNISSSDSDSEMENVSMVEGLKLYEKVEHLKQKLKLIENPLLRYLVGLMEGVP